MRLTHSWLAGNLAALALPLLAVAQERGVTFEALNQAFGIPIWTDDNLWDDADAAVGARLRWREESRTAESASFRDYAGKDARVLGARPFSQALQCSGGTASQISIVFANKGDVDQLIEVDPALSEIRMKQEITRQVRDYRKFIEADTRALAAKLTEALGEPVADKFGQGSSAGEKVLRWDWKGHAILLAAPRGEYVAVRIAPAGTADGASAKRVGDADLMAKLAARIEKRPNGDVVIRDIPMVDQGPKGYCVPATWERTLRYMGIPADMYVLAMAGSTEVGGGTSLAGMMAGVSDAVRAAGRRLTTGGGRVTAQTVARTIDKGLPIMWGMFVVEDLNRAITNRSRQRGSVTDWDAYKEMLKPLRQAARRIQTDVDDAHMCMIIGYNADTREIAISDSWGPMFAERWITEEEANAISAGQFYIVDR